MRYCERRTVSWVAHYVAKGLTREQVVAKAAARRPPFTPAEIEACWDAACQAVRNAELIRNAPKDMRLCDIPGCVFPKEG